MKPLLIVDGYNVIGAWPEASRGNWPLDASRDKLAHMLQDYAGYSGEEIVLVFDGYQSDRPTTTEEREGPILLVYTHHGETADSYIERYVAQTPRYRQVRVATSDGLEQSQVLSTGAVRLTSRELLRELKQIRQQGLDSQRNTGGVQKSSLASRLPQDTLQVLEKLRRERFQEPKPLQPVPVVSKPVKSVPAKTAPTGPVHPVKPVQAIHPGELKQMPGKQQKKNQRTAARKPKQRQK